MNKYHPSKALGSLLSALAPIWLLVVALVMVAPTCAQSPASLQLLFATGGSNSSGKAPPAKGYFGDLHVMTKLGDPWKAPGVPSTNRVSVLTSGDGTTVVMLILNQGPLYVSTNSGTSWKVVTTPGDYRFNLGMSAGGMGFIAAAKLNTVPTAATNAVGSDWYAVAAGPNRAKLVLAGSSTQPVPALTINHVGTNSVITWAGSDPRFVLQQNSDLATANWVVVSNSMSIVDGMHSISVPTPSANTFYRLKLP